ncbi:MAG: glycosyltransferase family 4 protein [Acidobacteriaceae bacterium]
MTQYPARVKLAYLVSHPIQYQAPLLRRIAQEPDIDLTVFFGSDFSVKGYKDAGFGVDVKWDIPLLEGYRSEFLPTLRDNREISLTSPISHGIFSRLRKGRFDALWCHGYSSVNTLQGIFAARALGIPVLLRAESTLIDRPRSAAKRFAKHLFFMGLRQFVDGLLPIGTLNAEYWQHHLGSTVPQFLMPYAVDNGYFQRRSAEASASRSALREELDLNASRPVILFASKFIPRKRAIDLVEAYLKLSPGPGQEPHPYLVMIGDGEEGPALRERAANSGFSSIRFLGFRNQSGLPRFFDLCDVFVLPSEDEPWGLIVNEAMNATRPVIVSNEVGCQKDLVSNGVEGIVFQARDVAGLADALRKMFAEPDTAAKMGANALKRMQNWSFEDDVRGLRKALAHVTGKIAP